MPLASSHMKNCLHAATLPVSRLQIKASAAGVGQVQHLALFLTGGTGAALARYKRIPPPALRSVSTLPEHLHLHRTGLGEPVATHGQATLLALTVAPARSTVATVLRIAGRFLRRKQAQTCQGLPRLLPRLPSFVWQHGTVPIEVAVGPHLSLGKEVGGILANGRQGSAVEALVVGPTLTLDFNPAHVVYHYESAGGGRYK